jgi:hypothetical protein
VVSLLTIILEESDLHINIGYQEKGIKKKYIMNKTMIIKPLYQNVYIDKLKILTDNLGKSGVYR